MASLELYNYFRSSTSYRVRIALELKGLRYDYKPVHLLKAEQLSENYRKINPAGELPALIHDGQIISQSLAILEYLDEVYPQPTLYPGAPVLRAQIRQFCENINSFLHPVNNLKVQQYLGTQHGFTTEMKEQWIQHWNQLAFAGLERLLEKHAGQWCFGDQITAADLCLIPAVYSARRFKVDVSAFPLTEKIDRAAQSHPAFLKAHPHRQVDTPDEFRNV